MDRRTIITKTGKGLMEATGKTSNLSRDLRNILKEIDGQVSVSSLLRKLDDLTEPKLLEVLARLEKEGYVREFFGQQDEGPPSRPAAPAPRAQPAAGADLDFSDLAAKVPPKSNESAKLNAQAQEIARQAQATRAREEAAARARAQPQAESSMSALDRARREAEERARRDTEERARRVEAERIRLEAEERARKEIEERALREITERSRREEEEKARKQAEERARRELEERVRREAEERARRETEERVKRELEARARREAEDRARREAEARARLEAELRARLDAEDRARREAEDRARYEAQERARREEELRRRADEEIRRRQEGAHDREREEQERREREELERSFQVQEDGARREAEEKARQDEERIRREWEERERIEAEVKAAAEEAARKEEKEEQAKAEEEAAPEEEEETPEERKARAKAKAKAEAKAATQARKEARAREKAEQKARQPAEATGRGRVFAKAAISARDAWEKRRPAGLGKMLATGLLVLLVVSIAILPFVPMDPVPYRKAAQSWLDEPVTIGSVNVGYLPLPHLRFEKVAIGKDPQIRVATIRAVPEIAWLLGDKIALKSLDLEGLSLPRQFLPALLSAKGRGESLRVERITAKGVKLDVANLALPPLDVDARLAPDGAVQSVTLSSAEGKLLATLQPQGGKAAIEVSADEFALPIGGDLSLGDFSATGTITATELALRKFEGRALGGRVLGNARVGWSDGWSLDGELEARQMSPARIAPQILSGDTLQGKGVYSMKALVPDRLFMNARLEGNFTVQKGSIHNVDMMRMLQSGGTGGTTPFTEMSGSVSADPDRLVVRQIRIVAGLMNAGGQVEMDPEKNLSGRLLVELRAATVQARTTVTVSGTLQDPQFRHSN